jgi:hypothetical protein
MKAFIGSRQAPLDRIDVDPAFCAATERISIHSSTIYLPLRTISCNGDSPRILIGNCRSRRVKPPDIARHSLVPSTGSSGRRGVDLWNRDQRISLLSQWPCKRSDMCWKGAFQSPRQNYLVIDNTLHGGFLSPAWADGRSQYYVGAASRIVPKILDRRAGTRHSPEG